MYVCMYVCMYVYMYIFVYVYVCIYIYIYIYILGVLGWSHRQVSARSHTSAIWRRTSDKKKRAQSSKTRTEILRKSFAKSFQIALRGALAERKAWFLLYETHLDAQKAWFLLHGSHIGRPKSLAGVLGAVWSDSGGFGGTPGTLREALGELSRHSRRASGRTRTPPGPPGATKK